MRKIGNNCLCKAWIVHKFIHVVVTSTILYKCCNAQHMHVSRQTLNVLIIWLPPMENLKYYFFINTIHFISNKYLHFSPSIPLATHADRLKWKWNVKLITLKIVARKSLIALHTFRIDTEALMGDVTIHSFRDGGLQEVNLTGWQKKVRLVDH